MFLSLTNLYVYLFSTISQPTGYIQSWSIVVATFAAIAVTVIAAPWSSPCIDVNSEFVNDLFTRNVPHEGSVKAAEAHGDAAKALGEVASKAIS